MKIFCIFYILFLIDINCAKSTYKRKLSDSNEEDD